MTTENKKEEICIKNFFYLRSGRIRGVLFLPILEKVNKNFPFRMRPVCLLAIMIEMGCSHTHAHTRVRQGGWVMGGGGGADRGGGQEGRKRIVFARK